MKKLILLALGVLLCFSCSSSDACQEADSAVSEEAVEKAQLASVQKQIESINNEMFYDNYQTRGLGRFLKKLFAVVLADVVGGMEGALGGPGVAAATAIVSSGYAATVNVDNIKILAPRKISQTDTLDSHGMIAMNGSNIAVSSSLVPSNGNGQTQKEDSIGYFHNLILEELNVTLRPTDYKLDNLITKVASATCKYYKEPVSDVVTVLNRRRTLFNNIFEMEKYSVSNCDNIHEIISAWKNNFSRQSDKFDVLESFFNGISNIDVEENNGEYLNRTLDVINKSSLKEADKKEFRNAFIVGNASYQLWNTEK